MVTELPYCPVKIKETDRRLSHTLTFSLNPTWPTFKLWTRGPSLREGGSLYPSSPIPAPAPGAWKDWGIWDVSVWGLLRSPEKDRPSLRSHSMRAAEARVLARDSLRVESL